MQLFVTSSSPRECAIALDDKRMIKSILESSQLLAASLYINRVATDRIPIGYGWYKHPLAKWVASQPANYNWTWRHASYCIFEYARRFKRGHSYIKIIDYLYDFVSDNRPHDPEDFMICTGDLFTGENVSTFHTYRMYLNWKWNKDKAEPRWTNRDAPEWRE